MGVNCSATLVYRTRAVKRCLRLLSFRFEEEEPRARGVSELRTRGRVGIGR